jgi:hypothetical protein
LDASAARVATSRDTVGSDATAPNTPGSLRSIAISAKQWHDVNFFTRLVLLELV